MMGSAFTVKYKNITQKLTTDIEITNNGNSIQSKALWDTGATDCCISKQVANSDKVICINPFREYFPPRTIHHLHSVQNGMSRQPSFLTVQPSTNKEKLNSRTVGFPHRYLLYQNHLILSSFVKLQISITPT